MECETLLNKENLVQCPFGDEQLTDVKSVEQGAVRSQI